MFSERRNQESHGPVYKFSCVIADIFCPVIVWSGSTRSFSCMQKTSVVLENIFYEMKIILSRWAVRPLSSNQQQVVITRTSDTTVTDHNITFSHALHSSSEQINNMYDIITFILQYLNHAMERFHIRRFFTSKSSMFAWWGLFTFHFTSTNNLRAVKVKLKVGGLSIFPTLVVQWP